MQDRTDASSGQGSTLALRHKAGSSFRLCRMPCGHGGNHVVVIPLGRSKRLGQRIATIEKAIRVSLIRAWPPTRHDCRRRIAEQDAGEPLGGCSSVIRKQ